MNTIKYDYPVFDKKMKKTHTILVPSMLPIHFELILSLFEAKGYKTEILTSCDPRIIEKGLKYVHNDICYPALLVIGQFIDALDSGKYDLNKVALCITQTGGGCRASNYIHLLRHALEKAGYGHIPVLSINFSGLEKHNSLRFTLPILKKCLSAITYGDMLLMMNNYYKAYELNPGDADRLTAKWTEQIKRKLNKTNYKTVKKDLYAIADDFAAIPISRESKLRVGIVGEIYVKFAPLGNNNLADFLRSQGCEAVVPGLMGFISYCIGNNVLDYYNYGIGKIKSLVYEIVLRGISRWETLIAEVLQDKKQFAVSRGFGELTELTRGIIDTGVKMGEGWLLPAEMAELIKNGVDNIVCAQPFGCLPNHICGKSVIKRIKELYPEANIMPIDYDAGATRVNQENRIKLLIAVGKENKEKAEKDNLSSAKSA